MGSTRHRRLYHLSMALLLLLVIAYLLVPRAIRWVVEDALRAQGFTDVQLANVDAELFAGELRVQGLQGDHGDDGRLVLGEAYLNIGWLALGRRHGLLQGLALRDLDLTLRQGADGVLRLSGLPVPVAAGDDAQPSTWGYGVDRLTITGSQLRLRLPGLTQTLTVDRLTLTGLRSWDADSPAQLDLLAHLDGARIRLDGQLTPFAEQPGSRGRLRIDGLDLAMLAGGLGERLPAGLRLDAGTLDADLRLDGRIAAGRPSVQQTGGLTLRGLRGSLDGQPQAVAKLAWQGSLDWTAQGQARAAGKLSANGLAGGLEGQPLAVEQLDWEGRLSGSGSSGAQVTGKLTADGLSIGAAPESQRVARLDWDGALHWTTEQGLSTDGRLNLHDAALARDGRRITLGALDWQGKAGWSADAGPGADGQAELRTLKASQPAQQLMLASVERIQIEALRLRDGDVVTFDAANLSGLTALAALDAADTTPRLRAQSLQLGASRLRGQAAIELGQLDLHAARLHLERDAAGKLPLLARLQADGPAADAAGAAPAQPAAKPRLVIAGLRIDGDSRFSFVDHSVQPAFRQDLDIQTLELGAMDSSVDGWSPVTLTATLGEYSRLDLTGKAKPLADKVNVDLQGTLKSVNLPPLSGYAAAKLGYNLQSGQLDADLDIKIIDNQLDGQAKLVINKLTVKAADQERMARLSRELSMPLDSALDMVRDGDDNIRLALPVSGDIHKPDFDLSNIINKALGRALRSAALSYLKYALQPYGSLITLAQLAGKAASRVSLKPIPFPAGSSGLAADAGPYLDKLDSLLGERPKLRAQLCGLATETDRLALSRVRGAEGAAPAIPDEQLLQLAGERAAGIKRQLVDRGTAPERLFLCNPEIDRDAQAEPRVELLL